MKRFQIKFSSQFLAIFLLVTRVKSKKICKPGQQDLTSQPFDLTAPGECGVLDDISRGRNFIYTANWKINHFVFSLYIFS